MAAASSSAAVWLVVVVFVHLRLFDSAIPDPASSSELASASDSSSMLSSCTATSAMIILDYGVPNIYAVPTTTVATSTVTEYVQASLFGVSTDRTDIDTERAT